MRPKRRTDSGKEKEEGEEGERTGKARRAEGRAEEGTGVRGQTE